MTTSGTSIDQRDRRAVLLQFPMLFGIATGLVCLGLLAAPFRSSAGLRAACFVFAFLILAFIWGKNENLQHQPASGHVVARRCFDLGGNSVSLLPR